MLQLDAIRQTSMQEVPYHWAVIENLLSQEASLELAASFPQENFRLSAGEGYGYLWGEMLASSDDMALMYNFGELWRERIAEGRLSSDLHHLSHNWQQLIQVLWQPQYRQALTQMSGIELKDCAMVIGFRRYNGGHLHRPHTDEPSKALTHLVFFNEQWPIEWGGCLRILKDEQPESVYQDIPPLNKLSAVIVRSDNSWHMVTPVTSSVSQPRLVLRIAFFRHPSIGF
ncbi:hypothetical protein Nos7524_5541 [Nostoc sp. PCC 7524]|uniref:2OG-Fe(II) oxygenase n=1 Tax=Nostoc sp. (strain ATCC 29411 / PCC 7524) TaxID=28072 RepID=UPI00029EF4B8|nr:2OG-Fe(II) oxygenase [Nostoc sp. PCC 7524]AFY51253.1 hypothetical protein Nos7524_5541 [Nostoc sp. PCC 7524]